MKTQTLQIKCYLKKYFNRSKADFSEVDFIDIYLCHGKGVKVRGNICMQRKPWELCVCKFERERATIEDPICNVAVEFD